MVGAKASENAATMLQHDSVSGSLWRRVVAGATVDSSGRRNRIVFCVDWRVDGEEWKAW
jgi:hypothetical protein